MNVGFRLMGWFFIFNLCTGLFMQIMPEFEAKGATGGVTYNANTTGLFIENMNKTVSPSQTLTDESTSLDTVISYINLGFIWRFLSVIDDILFGGLNVLYQLTFNVFDTPTQAKIVFGFLKSVVFVLYLWGALSLFMEKDI